MSENRPDPLTDTLLGVKGQGAHTLRVVTDADGTTGLEPSLAPAIDPGPAYWADLGPLNNTDTDLIALSPDVSPSEIEALAVTLWPNAGWVRPGCLGLGGNAYLRGPYSLDKATKATLKLPHYVSYTYLLDIPADLTGPIPQHLLTAHPLVRAYADNQPAGWHWEVLTGLYAITRRLAGAMRVAQSQAVVKPDPDSAVNLTVYAPAWIEAADGAALVRTTCPGAELLDAPPTPARPVGASRTGQRRHERVAREAIEADLGADEVRRLAAEARAFDEMAAAHPVPPAGYSLTWTNADGTHLSFHAEPTTDVPPALRWEPWADGPLAIYDISWLPRTLPTPGHSLSRGQRIERLAAAETIETLATGLVHLIGGAILDEDGFIIDAIVHNDA